MITQVTDLTESLRMPADTYAGIFTFSPPTPNGKEMFALAWGTPCATLLSGIRPLGWTNYDNTSDNGVQWFDTFEDALRSADQAHECLKGEDQ